jgi:hypothetical protein
MRMPVRMQPVQMRLRPSGQQRHAMIASLLVECG